MVLFLFLCAIPVLAIIWAIWYACAKDDIGTATLVVSIICAIMFFPLAIVGVTAFHDNPMKVYNFTFEKPLIEGSDNFLLVEKKNDWNEWLRYAQERRKIWGAFTMQPEAVELLTPIE